MLNIDPYTVLRENHKLKNTVSGLNSVVQEQADIIIKQKLRLSDLDSSLKRKKEEQRCLRGERMRLCKQLFRCQVDLLGLNKVPEPVEKGTAELLNQKGKRLQELLRSTSRIPSDSSTRPLKLRIANVAFSAERLLREIDGAVLAQKQQDQAEVLNAAGRSLADLQKVNKNKLDLLLNSGQPFEILVSPLLAGMLDAPVVVNEKVTFNGSQPIAPLGAKPDYRRGAGLLFCANPRVRKLKGLKESLEKHSIDDATEALLWESEELTRFKKNYKLQYTELLTVRENFKDIEAQTDEKPVETRAVGDDAEETTNGGENDEESKRDENIQILKDMGKNLFGDIDVNQALDGHEEEDADTCFGKSDTKVFTTTTSTASDEQIDQFTKICMSLRTDRQSMESRLQELHTKIHQRRKAAVESLKELETCLFKLEDFALDRTNDAAGACEMSAKDAESEKNKLRHLTQNAHTALHSMRQSMHRYSGQLELYGSMQQESKISAAVDIMLVYLKMLKDEHDQKDRELQKIKRDLQESITGTIIRRRMNKVRAIEIAADGTITHPSDTTLKLHVSESAVHTSDSEHYLDGPNLELRDVQLECDITANRDYLDKAFDFACSKFPKLESYLVVDENAIDHILDEEERQIQLHKLSRVRKVRIAQGFLLFVISIVILLAIALV